MVAEHDGGSAQAVPLDALLLATKGTVPPARSGDVSRDDLIRSARTSGCRVVGVTAPPGYGKSTLLAEWARVEDRPVAWLSLDRFDDDPAALVTLIAMAYARISAEHPDLVADVRGVGLSVLGRAAPRLATALRTSPQPFVLMLDDLHELRSRDCHDVLGMVINGIPPGSQFVAASRSEQPHLPRFRASAEALEFAASDLAFDVSGTGQVFADADIPISPETAAAVTDRTEGWPAGVYLAALIARDSHGEALSIAGDDRFVSDYLYRESLMRLPERTQHFLRSTSVLDVFSAPLCDAILDDSGSHQELRDLEASNTFLVPLDRRRGWYRYHALFREFLQGELQRVELDAVMKLHLRAADWFESNGSPAMAVEHLLNTTERDRCAQLVSQLVLPTYQAGQMSTVQRWIAALGQAAVEAYPPLAVLAGWTTAISGQTVETERWAAFIDEASFNLVPADGSASYQSARAMLRSIMCPEGPAQALADASFAVAAEPVWSVWRDTALCMSAEAHLLIGDRDRAGELFAETISQALTSGNVDTIALSEAELAMLAMDRNAWSDAAEHLRVALEAIDEYRMHDYGVCVLAFAAAARYALHRGDADEANRQLTRAMRARPTCTFVLPYLAVRLRLQTARLYRAMGDSATAHHLMREIDDILLRRPDLGVVNDDVREFAEQLASSNGTGTAGGPPLTPAELRLLPYLQTHLTLKEIGERLFVSRHTVSSEVSSIYRKLGVSSRNDAVTQAVAIGLLGG